MGRKRTNLTPKKWQEPFLDILSKTCNVTLAARGAGIRREYAYEYRATHEEFAKQWDNALAEAIELLEAEAWQRARKQSDTLMIFLLKAHKPEKYREIVRQEVTGVDGIPLGLTINIQRDDSSE